ncbi:MAG: 4Fe-4S binding protein [Clostridium argentinense]|uniref:4Fe-4S binding protein n=1 Tax=Clostridium butanoliproducens TaxID=2991837 RepID=UPI001DD4AF84|nr:4Fe-4S binding protein [Clostridium butanoliproducens]MBS5824062.1 4Fe-4S binding protein [Clostridium argentinense]MDU1350620.1 4Fe-4S binding protein [Clostridium argentinense]
MKKRKSYQKWSWIFMVLFIALSIYNVKFGLLGFICIGAPLFFVLKKQGKVHCSHYCPRGSLLQNFLRHISLQNNLPNKFKTKIVKNIILIFMLIMFITTIISSGGNIKLLGFGLFRMMTSSLILGIILGIIYKPRSWCQICPMGYGSGLIDKAIRKPKNCDKK